MKVLVGLPGAHISPETALKHVQNPNRSDCYGAVAKSIKKRNLDTDIVGLVGTNPINKVVVHDNKWVIHAILIDKNGEILTDTFSKFRKEFNFRNQVIEYRMDDKDVRIPSDSVSKEMMEMGYFDYIEYYKVKEI